MDLSSIFNPDILIGMGEAHQKQKADLLSQETARRKTGTGLLQHVLSMPDLTPEARDVVLGKLATASFADPNKPAPKGLFSLDDVLQVRPQVGKSVTPSQTMKANLPQSFGPPIPMESTIEAPIAPENYRRSGFYSPDELQSREEDVYRRREDIQTEAGIRRDRAKQQSELEFATLNPPKPMASKGFSSSPMGIYSQDTGEVTTPAPTKTDPESISMPALFERAAKGDQIAVEALRLAKLQNEGQRAGTLFERLGPEAYYEYMQLGAEARASVPTADMRNRALATKTIDPILSSISELSERINTGSGLIAKASGEIAKQQARVNYNDDVAEYQALISGFTPLVARAVGHTGVLTEQDVQSVKAMFPKPGDSKTLRDRKLTRLKSILGSVGQIQGQGGLTPPNPAGGTGGGGGAAPDGTIIRNAAGETMVKRGGQWVKQ